MLYNNTTLFNWHIFQQQTLLQSALQGKDNNIKMIKRYAAKDQPFIQFENVMQH
ncbi:hypothetical protein DPEC_G00287430 [Dallia pectoralis]|uniref:Uncharacterized protein n=1 Tax=Dallia pectoralis TaxID=75939 RepID=A0ACC2FK96_DALPE|nr:hypothetical protein DPEC_G00287430 [Dallia pectoralis]